LNNERRDVAAYEDDQLGSRRERGEDFQALVSLDKGSEDVIDACTEEARCCVVLLARAKILDEVDDSQSISTVNCIVKTSLLYRQ
jgi:hypothetical protein